MVPFGNGSFNNATFNQAFVHLKNMKGENGPSPSVPDPMQSREIMACTNLEDPRNPGTGNYTGFQQAYDAHQNPERYDRSFLSQFQGQPDITKTTALDDAEIRRRIATRQTMKLDYNRERLVTDLNVPLKEVDGIDSKKAAKQLEQQRMMLAQLQPKRGVDMFDRMSSLRAPAVQLQSQHYQPMQHQQVPHQHQQVPHQHQMPHQHQHQHQMPQLRQSTNYLPTGTPPPLQKKSKSKKTPSAAQSIEDELREMRKHLKQQNKLIKQLQSQTMPMPIRHKD